MFLIVLLLLVSPIQEQFAPVLKKCITSCSWNFDQCWYIEKYKCGRKEPECIDTENVECIPVIEVIGQWDPRPIYTWKDDPTPSVPTASQPAEYGKYSTELKGP